MPYRTSRDNRHTRLCYQVVDLGLSLGIAWNERGDEAVKWMISEFVIPRSYTSYLFRIRGAVRVGMVLYNEM